MNAELEPRLAGWFASSFAGGSRAVVSLRRGQSERTIALGAVSPDARFPDGTVVAALCDAEDGAHTEALTIAAWRFATE